MIDLVVNAFIGLLVGVVAFSFAALILAAAIYISSSAVIVKGPLIDFRRLADDETTLAILLFEDLAIAFVLGFAGGGSSLTETLSLVLKALLFIAAGRRLPLAVEADRQPPRPAAAGSSSSCSASRS